MADKKARVHKHRWADYGAMVLCKGCGDARWLGDEADLGSIIEKARPTKVGRG